MNSFISCSFNINIAEAFASAYLKQNESQKISFINLVKQMREVLKTSGFTQYPLLSWGKSENIEESIVTF